MEPFVPHPIDPLTPSDAIALPTTTVAPRTMAFTRLPLRKPDRSIWGYVIAVTERLSPMPAERSRDLRDAYSKLELSSLVLDRPAIVWATADMVEGIDPLPTHEGPLGLLIHSRHLTSPDAESQLQAMKARGVMIVLFDCQASPTQRPLPNAATHVMIDYGNSQLDLELLTHVAQSAGVEIIAENFTRTGSHGVADEWPAKADLIMSSIYGDLHPERDLTPSEVSCMEAVRLLSEEDVDIAKVATVMGTDPAMVVRLLRMVNASSEGLPRRVDSIQQAIILLGPTKVSGLVMASLIRSSVKNLDNLWLLIARGAACRELSGTDAGYTVGLLSALSHQTGIPARKLVEQTRVSQAVADAITNGDGPLGQVLNAVIAHEYDDEAAVAATGLSPTTVALAYIKAIPWALSTVIAAVTVK